MVILTGIVFLDPTFFPRLSYSVGEKMLGANIWFRLFSENLQAFASQYFHTVPNPGSHVDPFLEDIPALSRARLHSTKVMLAKLFIPFSFVGCTKMSCLRMLVFVLRESLLVLLAMPYCLKVTPKRKFNSLLYSAVEI